MSSLLVNAPSSLGKANTNTGISKSVAPSSLDNLSEDELTQALAGEAEPEAYSQLVATILHTGQERLPEHTLGNDEFVSPDLMQEALALHAMGQFFVQTGSNPSAPIASQSPELISSVALNPLVASAAFVQHVPAAPVQRGQEANRLQDTSALASLASLNAKTLSNLQPDEVTLKTVLDLPPRAINLSAFLTHELQVQPLNNAAALNSAPTVTLPINASSDAAFVWKSEQLGMQSSQWGQKLVHLLSDKVQLQMGQQIQRAHIRLDPPQLGLIELSVTMDGDKTTVQLYASNAQMREAMQQNLEQLRMQLAQKLGSERELDVDVKQESQQQESAFTQGEAKVAGNFDTSTDSISATSAQQQTSDWLNRLV